MRPIGRIYNAVTLPFRILGYQGRVANTEQNITMAKRFKILNAAIKYLATSSASDNPQAPTGSYLRQYQDWKSGAREVTYIRDSSSRIKGEIEVILNPFSYPVSDSTKALVTMSQRASESSTYGKIKSAANISDVAGSVASPLRNFVPAKAIVFVGTGGTTRVTGGSKITGVVYDKRNGASYTFPYGSSGTNRTESEVRGQIYTALTGDDNITVSFNSEKL